MDRTEADRVLASVATRQHGVFGREDASRAAMTSAMVRVRLERGRWQKVEPGVYRISGSRTTWHSTLMAAVLAGDSTRVASHRSAAALWDIPGFARDIVEVSQAHPTNRRARDVIVHGKLWLPAHHVAEHEAIPTTTVARTIFDLAGVVHPNRAERALDNCLNRGLVSVPGVAAMVDELGKRGRKGTRLMRQLLAARGPGYVAPASDLEGRFLELVRAAGLPLPEREVDVGDDDGWVGRVEFAYPERKLLIEVDGRCWHSSLLDLEADRRRDNRLIAAGWRILRITGEQVDQRPDEVVGLLRTALGTAA
jgi:hypothetical protein